MLDPEPRPIAIGSRPGHGPRRARERFGVRQCSGALGRASAHAGASPRHSQSGGAPPHSKTLPRWPGHCSHPRPNSIPPGAPTFLSASLIVLTTPTKMSALPVPVCGGLPALPGARSAPVAHLAPNRVPPLSATARRVVECGGKRRATPLWLPAERSADSAKARMAGRPEGPGFLSPGQRPRASRLRGACPERAI